MRGVLEIIDTAFPGRAAFDVAVSRALLREVATGKRPETLRLYRPDDVVAFSTTDLRPGSAGGLYKIGGGAGTTRMIPS